MVSLDFGPAGRSPLARAGIPGGRSPLARAGTMLGAWIGRDAPPGCTRRRRIQNLAPVRPPFSAPPSIVPARAKGLRGARTKCPRGATVAQTRTGTRLGLSRVQTLTMPAPVESTSPRAVRALGLVVSTGAGVVKVVHRLRWLQAHRFAAAAFAPTARAGILGAATAGTLLARFVTSFRARLGAHAFWRMGRPLSGTEQHPYPYPTKFVLLSTSGAYGGSSAAAGRFLIILAGRGSSLGRLRRPFPGPPPPSDDPGTAKMISSCPTLLLDPPAGCRPSRLLCGWNHGARGCRYIVYSERSPAVQLSAGSTRLPPVSAPRAQVGPLQPQRPL